MTELNLSQDELDMCRKCGIQRQTNNDRNKVFDQRYSNQSSVNIHIQGVIGEYAFRKLHDMATDDIFEDVNPRSKRKRTDEDQDAKTLKGLTIDVKTTHCQTREIRVKTNALRQPADYYVQMIVQNGKSLNFCNEDEVKDITVIYKGYVDGKVLLETQPQSRWPNQKFFVYAHSKLNPELIKN